MTRGSNQSVWEIHVARISSLNFLSLSCLRPLPLGLVVADPIKIDRARGYSQPRFPPPSQACTRNDDSRLGLDSAVRVGRVLLEPYLVTLFIPLHRVGSTEISLSSALRLDEKNRMGLCRT